MRAMIFSLWGRLDEPFTGMELPNVGSVSEKLDLLGPKRFDQLQADCTLQQVLGRV